MITDELKQKLIEFEDGIGASEIDCVKLLKKVFETNNLNAQEDGWSLLNYAINYNDIEIVKLLIKHGININLQDNDGDTVLHEVVLLNDIEIVKLLIENGININIKNQEGTTALEEAEKHNLTEIIKLFENADQIRQEFLEKQKEKILEQQIEEDKDKTPEEIIKEARENFAKILKR